LQVAGQVREIRRARHLSQRQLAGRMQVPRTYISKIENGKAIPTLGSLERLAKALEVEVCQLVRDSRSRREEEVAAIFSDPFLAEVAALLPQLSTPGRYGDRALVPVALRQGQLTSSPGERPTIAAHGRLC
jgi:transcriptional regulator with XRE-family HTH domain